MRRKATESTTALRCKRLTSTKARQRYTHGRQIETQPYKSTTYTYSERIENESSKALVAPAVSVLMALWLRSLETNQIREFRID